MMAEFGVDEAVLGDNAAAAAQYARDLKTWAEQFDDPQFYGSFEAATGLTNAPVGQALREHGARLRAMADTVAGHYHNIAEASAGALADVRDTAEHASAAITAATENL